MIIKFFKIISQSGVSKVDCGRWLLTFFNQLKKNLPKYISTFPIEKKDISNSILTNKKNLKKIVKIVHKEIRKKMYSIFFNQFFS